MKKAILCYDLATTERHCIATRNATTATPCQHGYRQECPRVVEQYVFVTTSPAAATAMGEADISEGS